MQLDHKGLVGPVASTGIEGARAWVQQMVKQSQRVMTTNLALVTPTLADALLECNKHNRTLHESNVLDFIAKLRGCRWQIVSHGISLSPQGELNNGQHRLHAISRAAIAAAVNISFGEPREAFTVLDTQRRRGAGATLEVMGEQNGPLLGAALRTLKNVLHGGRSNLIIENEDLAPLLALHPQLRDACSPGHRVSARVKCSAAGAAVAYYLIQTLSGKAPLLPRFWDCLATGAGCEHPRDPALVLRESLRTRQIYTKRNAQAPVVAASIINAWNLWSRDKRTVSVKWPDGTSFPEVL